jgi:hypothetical protein
MIKQPPERSETRKRLQLNQHQICASLEIETAVTETCSSHVEADFAI